MSVYHINFGTGKLEELSTTELLPVGSLVSYEDCANPRKRAVVTADAVDQFGHGQRCTFENGQISTVHATDPDRYGKSAGPWHFVRDAAGNPVVLTPEQIAEFIRAAELEGARLKLEAEAAAKAAAELRSAQRAEYLTRFAYLERRETSKKSSHALGAANLKRVLAREFPGVAFSVKSDSYSGGDSIDVHWTDGPTQAEVDRLCDLFQECDFDGMQDLETSRQNVFPELFGGASYVQPSRHVSFARHLEAAAALGYTITEGAHGRIDGVDYETQQQIYREARGRSYYVRPTAVPSAEPVAPGRAVVRINEEKHGVELVFPAKPAADILERVKAAGWRWSRFNGCWYAKHTAEALAFANSIAGTAPTGGAA